MLTAPVLWFAAMVVLLALEMMVTAGAFLFFAAGCFGAWVAALLDVSLTGQILAAVAVCVCSLLFFRKHLARVFSGKSSAADEEDDGLAGIRYLRGETGVVSRDIGAATEGQIEAAGSFWRAVSLEGAIAKGERVKIVGRSKEDALLLQVRRIA